MKPLKKRDLKFTLGMPTLCVFSVLSFFSIQSPILTHKQCCNDFIKWKIRTTVTCKSLWMQQNIKAHLLLYCEQHVFSYWNPNFKYPHTTYFLSQPIVKVLSFEPNLLSNLSQFNYVNFYFISFLVWFSCK